MSTKASYCEITITKAKKIILTIDLSKKESVKKKATAKPPEPAQPKTLYDLMQKQIDDLSSKTLQVPVDQKDPGSSKTTRKLMKKIIKAKRLRLSEVAAELGISKNNLKAWLMKGEKEEEDEKDYEELLQSWVMSSRKDMSIEDMYDVINRYNKSLSKTILKARPQLSNDPETYLMETIVLDNSFPRKKIHYDTEVRRDSQQSSHTTTNQALNLVQINVSDENVNIKDTVMWDSGDTSWDLTLQFADSVVGDFMQERGIKLPEEKVTDLVSQIQDQISKQVETANELQAQAQALATLNGNMINFKQKECIIKIQLDIKEEGLYISDVFDWEVDPVLNKPEVFAEQYVKENKYPVKFIGLISAQIRLQVGNYLRRRLNSFLKLYEPKLDQDESSETPEGKKKINNRIKENIISCLNENMESLPDIKVPSKPELFLTNQDLFATVKKYADYLSPTKKKIFQKQKVLFDQNYKKMSKSEPKKKPPTPPTPEQGSTINGKPHNLRPRAFNKNYRVLAGDLLNAPVITPDAASEQSGRTHMNTTIKGPTLNGGQEMSERGNHMNHSKASESNDKRPINKRGLSQKGHTTTGIFPGGRMAASIYRTNAKHYNK